MGDVPRLPVPLGPQSLVSLATGETVPGRGSARISADLTGPADSDAHLWEPVTDRKREVAVREHASTISHGIDRRTGHIWTRGVRSARVPRRRRDVSRRELRHLPSRNTRVKRLANEFRDRRRPRACHRRCIGQSDGRDRKPRRAGRQSPYYSSALRLTVVTGTSAERSTFSPVLPSRPPILPWYPDPMTIRSIFSSSTYSLIAS